MKTIRDYFRAVIMTIPRTETAVWMVSIAWDMIYDGRF
jgi:hypothetical protein